MSECSLSSASMCGVEHSAEGQNGAYSTAGEPSLALPLLRRPEPRHGKRQEYRKEHESNGDPADLRCTPHVRCPLSEWCYNANRSVWIFRASAPHSAIMRTALRIMAGGPHT